MSKPKRTYARPEETPPRRLASLEHGAVYMDTSVMTVRRYISSGRLTGYRLGDRLLRVDLNEIDAILRPVPTGGGDHAA